MACSTFSLRYACPCPIGSSRTDWLVSCVGRVLRCQHVSPDAVGNRLQGRKWLEQGDSRGHGGYRFTVQPQSVRRLFPESKQELSVNPAPVVQTNPLLLPGQRQDLVSPQLRNMIVGHSFTRRRPGGKLTPSQSSAFSKRRSLRRPSSGSIQGGGGVTATRMNPARDVVVSARAGSPLPTPQSVSPTRFAPTPQLTPKPSS
jgi:hypothetical protein